MEFRNLYELAAAKRHIREHGYTIRPINTLVNGRKGYVIENSEHKYTRNDYGLLALASTI